MKDKQSPVVPALAKALDILEYIATKGAGATIKELVEDLDIPAATAYRTVKYLASRRYLQENSALEGGYEFGPQLSYLAHLFAKQLSLVAEAQPAMRVLADQTGQTAQLGILHNFGVIYIEQRLPATPVSIIAALRTVIPVNVSACGKVLVAYLPPAGQDYFLRNAPLARQTENSLVDVTALKRELELVRERGYALDHEEYARGIGCAAAPIWDYRGQVVGAIGVTGHIADYSDPERLQNLIRLVGDAARAISVRMGASDLTATASAPSANSENGVFSSGAASTPVTRRSRATAGNDRAVRSGKAKGG